MTQNLDSESTVATKMYYTPMKRLLCTARVLGPQMNEILRFEAETCVV